MTPAEVSSDSAKSVTLHGGDTPEASTLADAIARAEAHSPFLRRLVAQRRQVADRLASDGLDAALAAARAASLADHDVAQALRRERADVALSVALADLAGAPLERVVAALTDFADAALERALAATFSGRGGEPRGFVALALGKQGSRELNYSSDIDPILLFDPATLPLRPREEPGEAATRIARALVTLLSERTGDGYVLRVDLRLRPAAEISPPALPVAAAITHYESSALPWERAAFIRARPVAGDLALGASFLEQMRPFVWRRGLDYGAIREVRALSQRIRAQGRGPVAPGPGFDLKRGRGGIREIEFFAQILQLIHGGRDPALRAPATLDALRALAAAGHLGEDEAGYLGAAYRLLRTIEHRLQMVADEQTHRLPADTAALDNVARLHGLDDGQALVALLEPACEAAGALYDSLEPAGQPGLPVAADAIAQAGAEAGFADPSRVAATITSWRAGSARSTRSPAARAALERLLPSLLGAIGRAPDPDQALARFDDLVTTLPTALNLFHLLEARPALFELLLATLTHAPALARDLARRGELLDGLIDARALALPPDRTTLVAAFTATDKTRDYQALLDHVRREVGERRFALGVQIVAGANDPLAVGAGYARVAEAALEVLAAASVAEFESAHGRVPGGELVILALGRLGGGLLTHASDLDLVYLFTGDFLAESDGARPLGATTYFNRLASRVSAALSVPTAGGGLYEVDTRLRPSGTQGLLAVSLDSFRRYEEEQAWTWEHMALTRARPVFGSSSARAALDEVIAATLRRPRDAAALTADAARMRGEIARHKPPAGPFEVKLIEGGLVDAEFTVHLLQLREQVGHDPDPLAAARLLEEAGLVEPGFATAAALLTRLLIVLRLVAPGGGEPDPASRELVASACGMADWSTLIERYAAARTRIGGEWRRVAGLLGQDIEQETKP